MTPPPSKQHRAQACGSKLSAEEKERLTLVQGALALYILTLREGSGVDIYHEPSGQFFEANVTKVVSGVGIKYLYANTSTDTGFVKFKDILVTWRPRLSDDEVIVSELLFIYDRMEKKTQSITNA